MTAVRTKLTLEQMEGQRFDNTNNTNMTVCQLCHCFCQLNWQLKPCVLHQGHKTPRGVHGKLGLNIFVKGVEIGLAIFVKECC